jgi:hypothetical protein
MPAKVIESVCYRDQSGRTFSPYSSYIPPDAERIVRGWTIAHPDGTVGLGRPAFITQAEAQAWIDAHPNFPGMNQG